MLRSVVKSSFLLPKKVHMCTKRSSSPAPAMLKNISHSASTLQLHSPIMRDDASTMGNEVCPFQATFLHIRGGSGVCKVIPRRHDVQGSCPRNRWNMSSVRGNKMEYSILDQLNSRAKCISFTHLCYYFAFPKQGKINALC